MAWSAASATQCNRIAADQGGPEGGIEGSTRPSLCRIRHARDPAGRMPTARRQAQPTSPIALQRKAPASLRRMQRF